MCHGYQENAYVHRADALEKSVKLSHKLTLVSKDKNSIPLARSLLELKQAHKNKKQHYKSAVLCDHMDIAESKSQIYNKEI